MLKSGSVIAALAWSCVNGVLLVIVAGGLARLEVINARYWFNGIFVGSYRLIRCDD